jgi:mannose-6-phosphate isomerase-like protein (cupin superfamily)/ribosome-associated toxin RatA of RatAB toxin-antitoxin module
VAEVAGHTEKSVRIHAPYDLVWDLTNDVERWPALFTEYAAAQVLERAGDTVRFRLTMHPDEHGRVWSWVSERTADRVAGRVDAHRVETGPFEYMRIRWTYEDEGEAVRMTWVQDFAMRPDAPLDDARMTVRIDRNSEIQMDVIRRKVEAAALAQAHAGRDGAAQATAARHRLVSSRSLPADRRRGGELRVVLGPRTVGSTSGFMGVATLRPGEAIAEHYHPYSEEFLFLVRGELTVDLDGEPVPVRPDDGLFVPVGVRHRLRNTGGEEAQVVFHLGPLAPRPELGHVDTETAAGRVPPHAGVRP